MNGGRYVFAHAMIHAVVYAEAGEARRSIFHRRAVQALQEAAAPAAELPRPRGWRNRPSAGVWQQAMRPCGW